MAIKDLLTQALERGASDLHIKAGTPPILRINGDLSPLIDHPRLTPEGVHSLVNEVMNAPQRERLSEKGEVDFAYSLSGLGRFRVNVFYQRGTPGLVFRVVPARIPTLAELTLPPILEKLALEPRGLLLVTGATGTGKSTTLASLINLINQNRTVHIVTIEDPIEFLHSDQKGILSQREVGSDTDSFGVALRSALRQDPDVILVGEMRDYETIATSLLAAETGHLVLSTLHTLDATETINRIIAVFPPYQQKQIRLQLASVVRAIISQRLVPRADGKGRVPAVEIMITTPTIRESIIDPDKTRRIPDQIAAGESQYGMQTFDQSLFRLCQNGLITYEEALRWCTSPEDFTLKMKGVRSTSDVTWEGLSR